MTNKTKLRDSTLIQLYTRANAPCRDYYGLTITENSVLLSTWKISYGPHLYPRCKTVLLEDIKDDKFLQQDIRNTFGLSAFEYIRNLYLGKLTLQTLPKKLFVHLMKYLKINDILNLSRISKIMSELCNNDDVWQVIYQKVMKRKVSAEEMKTAKSLGWKELTKNKVFSRKKMLEHKNLNILKRPEAHTTGKSNVKIGVKSTVKKIVKVQKSVPR